MEYSNTKEMMTTMTKKQFYTAPTLEILALEAEVILAGSTTDIPVYGEDDESNAIMSNKKDNPWEHSWE